MDMIASRNLTLHTYNQDVADRIVGQINDPYYPAFCALERTLDELAT